MNYLVSNPTKMGCYTQSMGNLKTLSAAKSYLNADVIVNFQLFNWDYTHALAFKLNGKVLANDGANYWGYCWNNGDTKLQLGRMNDCIGRYDNFAGSVLVAKDGKAITNPEFGSLFPYVRGRTCIGRKANGDIVIYCWPDGSSGAVSINKLGEKMVELGCVDAINYDGGGSSQIDCPNGTVNSTRYVASMLWFQLPKTQTAPVAASTVPKCPYAEPKVNIRLYSRGEGAKWMQWHLNQHGAKLVVDGIIGSLSRSALITFQKQHGLVADGICGALTRAALKQL